MALQSVLGFIELDIAYIQSNRTFTLQANLSRFFPARRGIHAVLDWLFLSCARNYLIICRKLYPCSPFWSTRRLQWLPSERPYMVASEKWQQQRRSWWAPSMIYTNVWKVPSVWNKISAHDFPLKSSLQLARLQLTPVVCVFACVRACVRVLCLSCLSCLHMYLCTCLCVCIQIAAPTIDSRETTGQPLITADYHHTVQVVQMTVQVSYVYTSTSMCNYVPPPLTTTTHSPATWTLLLSWAWRGKRVHKLELIRNKVPFTTYIEFCTVYPVLWMWPNKAIYTRPGIVESLWHRPLHTVAGVYVNNVALYTQNAVRCIWHTKGVALIGRQWDRQSKWSFFLITALHSPVVANQFIIKDLHIQEVTSGERLLFQGKFHRFIPLWLQAVVNVLCLQCPPCVSNNACTDNSKRYTYVYTVCTYTVEYSTQCMCRQISRGLKKACVYCYMWICTCMWSTCSLYTT